MKLKTYANRVLAIIMLMTLIASLSACGAVQAAEETVKSVKTQTVNSDYTKDYNTISGNIVPEETVKLSFKVNGIVNEILVGEGDFVKSGEPIAKLKTEDYNLAVSAAKAEYESSQMSINKDIPQKLEQAKAKLDLTQTTYNRIKELYDHEAVSKSQMDEVTVLLTVDSSNYEQVKDAYDISITKLGQAKAAYDKALNDLQDTIIYSPIDGVVLKKVSSAGEVQGAGYPVVVLGSVDKVWAEFGVTDAQIGKFSIGQKISIYVYGADLEVEGVIKEVGALADEKTRLFTVKAEIDNAEGKLKSGMIAKASFESMEAQKYLIPFLSVVHKADKEVVFLYDTATESVVEREVTVGDLVDDRIEIVDGLEVGDILVIEGQYKIQDGEKVKLND